MIQVAGNLWTLPGNYAIITTNGFVRRDGCAVMGRGTARQARDRFPELARELGRRIKEHGNILHEFPQWNLFTFPVKHAWDQPADLVLIAESARALRYVAEDRPDKIFLLPRPGCGNGQLEWVVVEPLLRALPDNVHVIDLPVALKP